MVTVGFALHLLGLLRHRLRADSVAHAQRDLLKGVQRIRQSHNRSLQLDPSFRDNCHLRLNKQRDRNWRNFLDFRRTQRNCDDFHLPVRTGNEGKINERNSANVKWRKNR